MKRAIKKFISLFVLLLVFLFAFSPFFAEAFWPFDAVGAAIGGALSNLANSIIQAIANLVILGIGALLGMAYGVLQWVISPDFLQMTMTGPDNLLVYNAWAWVRDLANIFLVLGLIVIALGIILGIKEYEAKRTLPVLIVIALLINFTPVICGWVIDFSNFLMKHLLTGGFNNNFVQAISNGLQNQGGAKDPIKAIIDSLAFIIFGIVAVVIIVLYCLLFLLRYIFLWVLIIFSPIAFVSRVFGPNRYIKMFFPGFLYWDSWWASFIQWCAIGVFGAFFIFLANKSMVDWVVKTSPGPSILANLYVYIFPILILLIGFFATISAASQGMEVLPGSKIIVKTAAEKAQKGAKWAGKKVGEAVPERARRKGEEWARYMPKWTQYGKGEAGAKGWMKRRLGQLGTIAASPYIVAKQGIGRAVSAPAKIEKEDISKAFKESLGKAVEEQLKAYNKPTATRGERIGTLQAIIRDNNLDDAKMLMKPEEKERFEEQVKRDMGEAALIGNRTAFNIMARANPHYIDDVATRLNSEIRKRMSIEPSREELLKIAQERGKEKELREIEELLEKGRKREAERRMNDFLKANYTFIPQIIKGIKPETVGDMSAESMGLGKGPQRRAGESDEEFNKRKEKYDQSVKEVWDAIHKYWLPENNVAAIKIFKKMFADKYMEGAKERGTMWYVVNNPTMATYLTSMFAPESGLFAPEKVSLQQINAWQEQLNRLSPEIRNAFEEAFNQLKEEQRKNLERALKKNPERLADKELKDISEQKTLEGKIEKLEDKINKWTTEDKKGQA